VIPGFSFAMKFIILTLFPKAFESYLNVSILARAQAHGLIDVQIYNLRDWGDGVHKSVDDRPYGGGAGMVLRVDIIDKALKSLKVRKGKSGQLIALMTPQGKIFKQADARKFSKLKTLVLICGRFEGFDDRVRSLVDMEISMGDFVLTGGEIPALAIVDSVARLIPGVVGKKASLAEESFSENLLEYPQYTSPEVYKKMKVPTILQTGHHGKISEWRKNEAFKRTKKRRPDLLGNRP